MRELPAASDNHIRELPAASAAEEPFSDGGSDRPPLPHQQIPVGNLTATGGVGLTSCESKVEFNCYQRLGTDVGSGSLCGCPREHVQDAMPAALMDMSGPLGDNVRRALPRTLPAGG